MVNKNSHADHFPERTCVICREKTGKEQLLRFVIMDNEIIIDINMKISARGYYVCDRNSCIEKLDKWKKKLSRR
ncbi:YlxR family protein [Candidatus Cloacimonadota bacterium]